MTKETQLEKAATDMMFLFIMNSNKEGRVTDDGLAALSARFNDVAMPDRADVYVRFLKHLDMHEIEYNIEQFAY